MKRFLRRWVKFFLDTIIRLKAAHVYDYFAGGQRHRYQDSLIDFNIPPAARVLDIGSGPAPFRHATILCERFLNTTVHRHGKIETSGLPIVVADIHALPFATKLFDFVYSAHVLEHIDDPTQACREMMRVSKRGYFETPNLAKDMLFCQAEVMHHRWHTIAINNTVYFFEYTARQRQGIRSSAWSDVIWSDSYHPLQDAFVNNQDMFNTMFLWDGHFDVQVIKQKD